MLMGQCGVNLIWWVPWTVMIMSRQLMLMEISSGSRNNHLLLLNLSRQWMLERELWGRMNIAVVKVKTQVRSCLLPGILYHHCLLQRLWKRDRLNWCIFSLGKRIQQNPISIEYVAQVSPGILHLFWPPRSWRSILKISKYHSVPPTHRRLVSSSNVTFSFKNANDTSSKSSKSPMPGISHKTNSLPPWSSKSYMKRETL